MTFPEILNLNQFIHKEPTDKPNGPSEEILENFISEKPVETNSQDVQELVVGELIKPLSEDEANKIDGDNSLTKNFESRENENGLVDNHFGQDEDEGIELGEEVMRGNVQRKYGPGPAYATVQSDMVVEGNRTAEEIVQMTST